MIKFNIHSIVDVITNSSTVIYTWKNNTKEGKEVLQEILNLMGVEESVDDLFGVESFIDEYRYSEIITDNEIEIEGFPTDYKEQNKYIKNLIEQILKGEIEKPNWMKQIEEVEDDYTGFSESTNLYIFPKDDKYKPLADKMLKFLNSPTYAGERDG